MITILKFKTAILFAVLSTHASFANATTGFCAPQAILAAQALANVNGTISKTGRVTSRNGKIYQVSLTEQNLGEDQYIVQTSGGHDCSIQSVKAIGPVTSRP